MRANRSLAVITGTRRGIGAAIAVELALRGFDLALTDIEVSGAEEVLAAAAAAGARARMFESDLGRIEEHRAVVDKITAWGGAITCLVNNAGVPASQRGDLLDVAAESFDRVLDVNLRGTFFFTQTIARHMVAAVASAATTTAATTAATTATATATTAAAATATTTATAATTATATPTAAASPTNTGPARTIITISSVSAELASIERGEYCVSKAGLGMLTKLFALRLAPHRIGVFEIRPGIIRTPMTAAVAGRYDALIAGGLVPMARWGEPQDVARAVAALATGELNFSSGSVLQVDGALSIPRL